MILGELDMIRRALCLSGPGHGARRRKPQGRAGERETGPLWRGGLKRESRLAARQLCPVSTRLAQAFLWEALCGRLCVGADLSAIGLPASPPRWLFAAEAAPTFPFLPMNRL